MDSESPAASRACRTPDDISSPGWRLLVAHLRWLWAAGNVPLARCAPISTRPSTVLEPHADPMLIVAAVRRVDLRLDRFFWLGRCAWWPHCTAVLRQQHRATARRPEAGRRLIAESSPGSTRPFSSRARTGTQSSREASSRSSAGSSGGRLRLVHDRHPRAPRSRHGRETPERPLSRRPAALVAVAHRHTRCSQEPVAPGATSRRARTRDAGYEAAAAMRS